MSLHKQLMRIAKQMRVRWEKRARMCRDDVAAERSREAREEQLSRNRVAAGNGSLISAAFQNES